ESLTYYCWAVATVFLGWGVWSLASATVVRAVAGSALMAMASPLGFVTPKYERRSLRSMLAFGLGFQAVGIAAVATAQGVNLVVAAAGGVQLLGYWSLANRLLQVPFWLFQALWRVSYPMMARLRALGENTRPTIERFAGITTIATGAILAPLAASAHDLVPALFGDRWAPAASPMPWAAAGLAIGGPISVAAAGYLYSESDVRTPLFATAVNGAVWVALTAVLIGPVGVDGVGRVHAGAAAAGGRAPGSPPRHPRRDGLFGVRRRLRARPRVPRPRPGRSDHGVRRPRRLPAPELRVQPRRPGRRCPAGGRAGRRPRAADAQAGRSMSVDVVVVNYRSAPVIGRAVAAARELLGDGVGAIMVDNSPGDGAAEAVRAVAPDARVLANRRNRGFAAAVNRAIAVSTADVVLLLNPDVERIAGDRTDVEAAFADPRVAAVSARLELPDGSPLGNCFTAPRAFDYLSEDLALAQRFPGWGRPRRFRQLDRDPAEAGTVEWTSGACLFLRRAAVGDVGPFDERFFVYCEETDWLVRAARRGW